MPAVKKKRLLIVVRTYPAPAHKGAETSCTAAITEDGEWVRMFPLPYRSLPKEQKFHKFQWIDAELRKARSDARPESHNINLPSIVLGNVVPTTQNWRLRRALVQPLIRPSMCAIRKELNEKGSPTLGLFRPKRIKRLVVEPTGAEWTAGQKAILSQMSLLPGAATPKQELEKIPYNFKYEFVCDAASCRGHKMLCTDWEMAEAYRRWRKHYGDGWEGKFRERFENEMIEKFDTHFFVGTIHGHPKSWLIVGLFYPPRRAMGDLFEG